MEQAEREVGGSSTDGFRRQEERTVRRRRLDECVEKEDGRDDPARKRRRLLGGESRLVLTEGGVAREVLGRRDFCEDSSFTETVGDGSDVISLLCDSSDVDTTSEEEDNERPDRCDSDGWRVALAEDPARGFTEAQWHCYWREQGWFIDNNMPFPLPFP